MRVLQLIDSLDAGGAERMAVNITNALSQDGVESYICATRRGGSLESELFVKESLFILNKKATLDVIAFFRFFKWLKRKQINIIHAHSTSIHLAVFAKIYNNNIKVIWHDHYGMSDSLENRKAYLLKLLGPYINTAIVVNPKLALWSKEMLKINKVHFLQNFATLKVNQSKKTLLYGETGKRIVCLANLRPQKNHLALIDAFAKTQLQFPDWTLHLVGKSFNDDYSKSVMDSIITNNLSNNVFLYGSCQDISHILNQSTIGVLTSLSEGLPVSLLEYANCGLPVVVTNVGQCAEVVGQNGFVVNNVIEELPDVLTQLIKNKDNIRGVMGDRFRESVSTTYSKDAFIEKLMPIYNDLIS